jgi:hypothetical protein
MSPRWGSKIFPSRNAINMSSLTGLKKKGKPRDALPTYPLPLFLLC